MNEDPGHAADYVRDASILQRKWAVVAVLFMVQLVNYADKSVVGLAAKPIMRELDISPERYGLLASSFFSLYAMTGLLVAFVAAPRYRPGSILSVLLLVWSIAQVPVAFSSGFLTLMACRVVLGMGEGAGAPTALNASHEWFPATERNLPSAIVMFGALAGSLIAAPGLSYVIALAGWRAAFLTCSGLGGAALLLWTLVERRGPYSTFTAPPRPSSSRLEAAAASAFWSNGTVIGNVIVGFCSYWITGFMVAWLAPYVGTELGFGLVASGWVLAAIYSGQAMLLLLLSYLSQALIRRGVTSRIARGHTMGLCLVGSSLAFATTAYCGGTTGKLLAVAFATGLPAVIFPLSSAMLSEIAPPENRNKLVTIVFSVITIAAILSPLITGRLVASGSQGWRYAFVLHGAVALVGAIVAFALLRPERSMHV